MINNPSNNLFYLTFISVLLFTGACHVKKDPVPFPIQESEFRKPGTEPLVFSEPKAMNLVPQSPKNTLPREVKKLDFDKLPSRPFYPDGYVPMQTPPVAGKFDFTALRDSAFNLDQIPSRPLKVETSIIEPPKIVKASLPKLIKNASLGIFEFGEDQGLPGALVSAMMQDSHGMLWIGTDKGVCRFNGEFLEIYSFVGAIFTGSQDYISSIVEDKLGRIWVSTNLQGIYILDTRSGIVHNFKIPLLNSPFNNIYDMIIDSRGFIWTGNAGSGLWVVNPEDFTFKALTQTGNAPIADARQIAEDHQGNVWLSRRAQGIRIIDRTSGNIRFFDERSGLSSNTITTLFVGKDNRIWIGTEEGTVHIIDLEKGLNIQLGKAQGINHPVKRFVEDGSGDIWMASVAGLYVYKEASNQLRLINAEKGLSNNDIATLFKDDKGQVWIATSSGLNVIDTRGIMPIYLAEKDGLGSGEVWSFMEDIKHRLWIGSIKGVDIYDPAKKTIQALSSEYLLPKRGNVSYEVRPRDDGKIMIFARGMGLQIIDPLKETITNITAQQGLQNTFPACFVEDNQGRVWTGSFAGRGIEIIDLENKTFTLLKKENGLKGSIIWEMTQISDSVILATSDSAVNVINPIDGTITYLMKKDNVARRLNAGSVVVKEGKIWIGTRDGLLILDNKKKILTSLKPENGLVAPDVYTLYQFKDRIYVGTGNGLTVYTPNETNTRVDSGSFNWDFKSYGKAQGMLYNNYNANGAYAYENKLWWGIENKALTITDEPTMDSDTATTYISGITIADVNPSFFDLSGLRKNKLVGDTVWNEKKDTLYLKDNISVDQGWLARNHIIWDGIAGHHNLPVNLQIPFGLNYLSFQFTGSQLSNRDKSRYRYMLEGIDEDWSPVTASSTSKNYRDIPAGSYTFKVASKGFNDVWSEPAEFSFTILSPWYASWYAYVLYGSVFTLLVWSIVQYRSKQLKKENLILERKVEHRTEQLNKSIEDLKATQSQLIHSEKMASLGELTAGIAHEIQNPLNFVNNFSEVNNELVDELQEELKAGKISDAISISNDIKNNQEKINFHGKRADAIVKGMLQHSRSSSGVKEPTNINALADEYLRLAYHGLRAKDKSFNSSMKTDFDKSIGSVNIIPQDIGRVILNLFTNAFYAVAERNKLSDGKFEPTVSVTTKKINNGVEIRVKDNGNGIPQKVIDKIFQPFFTTKPTGEGTGLGLSMSYDIVKAHDGVLKVETHDGEGAEFIIILPE